MTKVTVHNAGAEPPKPAGDADEVVDSLGRHLKIREPDILAESRLVRVMGEHAINVAYMTGYVMPAVMVVAIDGEEQRFPTTALQVEAAIQRLGREGQAAVMKYLTEKITRAGGQDLKNS